MRYATRSQKDECDPTSAHVPGQTSAERFPDTGWWAAAVFAGWTCTPTLDAVTIAPGIGAWWWAVPGGSSAAAEPGRADL